MSPEDSSENFYEFHHYKNLNFGNFGDVLTENGESRIHLDELQGSLPYHWHCCYDLWNGIHLGDNKSSEAITITEVITYTVFYLKMTKLLCLLLVLVYLQEL